MGDLLGTRATTAAASRWKGERLAGRGPALPSRTESYIKDRGHIHVVSETGMRILIPDGPWKNVTGSIRLLARNGHTVDLATPGMSEDEARRHRSRYTHRCFSVTSPLQSIDRFVQDLCEILSRERYDVVMPFTLAPTVAVSYLKDRVENYAPTTVPPYQTLVKAHDKRETLSWIGRTAQRGGRGAVSIDAPALYELETAQFPCVVKARRSCGVSTGVRLARNRTQLDEAVRETRQPGDGVIHDYTEPLIQEYIPGRIHDCLALYNRGEARVLMTQERTVTFPAGGGVGAVNTTTQDRALKQKAEALLDGLGWHGPCQTEWKLDSRDARYKLIEVNPKFWGTLELSIEAGIPFPILAAQIATSGDAPYLDSYRIGLRHRWIPLELCSALGQPGLARMIGLAKFLGRFMNPAYRYSFDPLDMRPAMAELAHTAKSLLTARNRILWSPWPEDG